MKRHRTKSPLSHTAYALAANLALMLILLGLLLPAASQAATAREIEVSVDVALERFAREVKGGQEFLNSARGVLVFPHVYKAGIGIGGEYGEGALRLGGKTVDYYSTAGASFGFQLGAQKKTLILVFMQASALQDFRASHGWEVGIDGSVALIDLGVGVSLDSTAIRAPIVGFVFAQKGLMYNLTLEGSKFTRIAR